MQFQKFESTESTSFFCEPVSKLKAESGSNLDQSNSHLLEKPKQTAKTNNQIWETETRFMKSHRNCY